MFQLCFECERAVGYCCYFVGLFSANERFLADSVDEGWGQAPICATSLRNDHNNWLFSSQNIKKK